MKPKNNKKSHEKNGRAKFVNEKVNKKIHENCFKINFLCVLPFLFSAKTKPQ